ncbi:MAG: leucine-rich repeat domain-containing protein [Muribaculaceae bacterium]|nr:leucine-rich repeat domain-containing protein [Muribaculaceae bacterium]
MKHRLILLGFISFGIALGYAEVGIEFKYELLNDESVRITGIAQGENIELNNVIIPETVNYNGKEFYISELGDNAFRGLDIEAIRFPASLKKIGAGCFTDCKNLINVGFNDGLESIGDYAFSGSALKELFLNSPKIELGEYSFSHSPIEKIEIAVGSEVTLKKGVFSYCQLRNLSVPGSIYTIPSEAFAYNPIQILTLSKGGNIVIEENAFDGCRISKMRIERESFDINANAFIPTGFVVNSLAESPTFRNLGRWSENSVFIIPEVYKDKYDESGVLDDKISVSLSYSNGEPTGVLFVGTGANVFSNEEMYEDIEEDLALFTADDILYVKRGEEITLYLHAVNLSDDIVGGNAPFTLSINGKVYTAQSGLLKVKFDNDSEILVEPRQSGVLNIFNGLNEDEVKELYDLNGLRIDENNEVEKGIYIIREGSSYRKVIVK